jgi:hypothetical protein
MGGGTARVLIEMISIPAHSEEDLYIQHYCLTVREGGSCRASTELFDPYSHEIESDPGIINYLAEVASVFKKINIYLL